MPKIYRWVFKNEKDPQTTDKIQQLYGLPRVVAEILSSKVGAEEVNAFLNPTLKDLHSPFLLKGIKEAKELIQKHVYLHNRITIYGDYDVDGITATSVLYMTLKKLGANVDYYIPERLTEGYGINEEAIDKIASQGSKLIVTVDCGITSVEEVKRAKTLGMDVIITDHHSVPKKIPEANVVINPHLPDIKYPFCDLAGVGVAFKLCEALIGKEAYEFLDIVAIGTIADIVPLIGENRVIVKEGLKVLNKTNNMGLKALIKVSGIENMLIDEYHVGFILAPRFNAAGRLKSAEAGVRLLISENEKEAQEIAEYLNNENATRQQIESRILQEAIKKVEESIDLKNEKVIVLWDENWHPGVIGIVASRITERYFRPSILISLNEGGGKGSARSIEGFNLYNALDYCKDYLIKYGGHEMAAGIIIDKNNIEAFKREINKYADNILTEIDLIPVIKIDASVKNDKIDIETAKKIQMFKPFGNSNPRPTFLLDNLTVSKVFSLDGDKHIKIIAQKNKNFYELMLFDAKEEKDKIKVGSVIDVVGSIELNSWNGIESVVINVKDIKTKPPLLFYYKSLGEMLTEYRIKENDKYTKSAVIIDRRGIRNKCEYVLKLFKENSKTVVLVNTVVQMKSLIRYLKRERFVDFSLCSRYCEKDKAIIFLPNYLKSLNYYDNIVFYDIPFKKEIFYNIVSMCEGKKIHLIFGPDDIYYNLKSFEEIFPERKDFVKLYRFIEEGNTILFKDYMYHQLDLNPVKSLFCINAMKEIGLINVKESDNIFMLSKNSVSKKVNIEQTRVMRQILLTKKEFIEFAKFIVSQKF
ncbi:single-stranded-DNA-specific exonuclease RecJ [Thermoanaerobacter kivui]|nr:single-stranded-DNA-specific exonuclease RecJ [Thermoanaerobacter kivui]